MSVKVGANSGGSLQCRWSG